MKKINIIVLSGSKKMNDMARACDIFEPSKVYAKSQTISIHVDESKFDPEKSLAALRASFETVGDRMVAMLCRELGYVWYDESVVSVSDGKKWGLLRDFLKSNGVLSS